LYFRNSELIDSNFDVVISEFINTLDELKDIGVVPIVVSPPPANDVDLGKCLAKADWMGLELSRCNFDLDQMSQSRMLAYRFLDFIEKHHHVIRLEEFLCKKDHCRTHFKSIWVYRDKGHLSQEGSIALGKRYEFYDLILSKK
jgi:hypothetical protein